jgi:protein O-GlcNAc transferase
MQRKEIHNLQCANTESHVRIDSEQAGDRVSLSDVLSVKDGQMHLDIPKLGLPEFIIKANSAADRGRISEAAKLFNDHNVQIACEMAEKDERHADIIYLLLALMFQKIGENEKAARWYKKILEHQENAFVYNELGCIYQSVGRVLDAMECRKTALQLDPTNPGISSNYAADLMRTGKLRGGIAILRDTLKTSPANPVIHSNLLFYMHYLPDTDPKVLFEEHKKWGQIHAPLSLAKSSHENAPDPERRLKIGYISPDFRMHSVAYNFEAFLTGRDCSKYEVYGYGNISKPDEMTEHLKNKFDHYRNIRSLSDETVAGMIEKDRIDILVEIGGHSGDHSLLVLACKPAPIQVDYGGINTSGMDQIDYRLTDHILDPPGAEELYVEELVHLPGGLFCYTPHNMAPPVAPPPVLRKGHITFGSCNGSLKIDSNVIAMWAHVLKANEGSRFFLKFPSAKDPWIKDFYWRQFERFGIERERVHIQDWKPTGVHLQLYGEVDIALDAYPFNGCITTLEGLWMGVPVISLSNEGHSFLPRVGRDILSRLGLDFFAASTPDEYIAKATALASNVDNLAKIRATTRQRMAASILCDAKAYTGSVEAAYRKMWHKWCQSQASNNPNGKFKPDKQSLDIEASARA